MPSRQAYDLILKSDTTAPIGLMLRRPPAGKAKLASRYGPAHTDEAVEVRDVPMVMDDFSGGALYSQRYLPNTYAWGEGICARWPRVVIPAGELTLESAFQTLGNVNTSFVYGGHIRWVTAGGYVIRSQNGTEAPIIETYLGNWSIEGATTFNGSAYIGGSNGPDDTHSLWRLTDSSWVEMVGVEGRFLRTVYSVTGDNVGANRMWASIGRSSVKYVAGDPAVPANWSGSIPVGEGTYAINALAGSSRHIWAIRQDGVHDIDELGHTPNITPAWKDTLDPVAGNCHLVHDGFLYAGNGVHGLDRIDLARQGQRRDVPDWVQPGYGIPNETPINGHVSALTVDQGWIVAAMMNPGNGNAYVMYGMDRSKGGLPAGPGPILWHGAEAVIEGTPSNPVFISGMRVYSPLYGNPMLWITTYQPGAGGEIRFWKLSLPRAASPLSDVLYGGAHRFNTNAKLYMTAQDWGQEYGLSKKQLWKYDIRADGLGGLKYLDLYSNDAGGAYALEGRMTSSPRDQIGPSYTDAHTLGLRVDLHSQPDGAVQFRGIRARAEVMVEQNEYIPYEVEFGEGVKLRDPDSWDRQDAATVKARLIALQQERPFEAIDEDGRRMTVRLSQGMTLEKEEMDEEGKWRGRASFLLRVMGRPARYNSGDTYNSGATYA